MHYTLEDTIHKTFTTRAFATGIPTVLAGTPVVSAYEDDSVTQITAGITLGVDHDSVVGLNLLTLVLTAANGYEAGKDYNFVITTGTVGGVSVVGETVLSVSLDSDPAFVRLGAPAGASVSADIAVIEGQTDDIGVAGAGLTAINLPNQTMDIVGDITGNLSGSVGSNIELGPTEVENAVHNASLEDHDVQGQAGWSLMLVPYSGPRGLGIFIDDGAANTNVVPGTDGTWINPVSTFAAARTLADATGIRQYYFTASDLTLAATHEDWSFVGLGELQTNVINLGSQDVDRSQFYNMTIEGEQGGTQRIWADHCALQDPGAGTTTLHIRATDCGIVDDISVDTSNDNVFVHWYSLVGGTGAPIIRTTGASGTLKMRHGSGGVELVAISASHNISVETDGQVIFNASCNVNANVVIRGNMEITDNTAGMNNLTQISALNTDKINAEVDTALSDYDGPTNAEMEARTIVSANYALEATLGTPADTDIATDIAAVKADTVVPEKNAAFSNIYVLMVDDTDHVTPKTGLTLTVERSLDGGAFGAAAGTAAEISDGMYQFDATDADMNGDTITFRFSGTDADDTFLTIVTR